MSIKILLLFYLNKQYLFLLIEKYIAFILLIVEDFGIWATKTFNETFSLAAQAFYKYDWNHKFSGRVQANVNLKNGLWAQLSFTAKDWKITPTAWVMYKF